MKYEYAKFDAIDEKDNIYEFKFRNTFYNTTLIEFDKFSYNIMYANIKKKRFLYVVRMKDNIYIFNVSDLYKADFDFQFHYRLMPLHTEFYNSNKKIKKYVGYIPIDKAVCVFDTKKYKNLHNPS
tara:strand:+ start:151 stop:525 length:375 start_codon:yes stop_codon:yes gene_type:complete